MDDVILQLTNLNIDLNKDSVIVIVNKIVTANPRYYQNQEYKAEVLSKAKAYYHALPDEVRKARAEKAKERYKQDEAYRNKIRERSIEWFKRQKAKASEPKATTILIS
jgi:glutamyl/glutaminyl-tRNA synthetase